jgi:hypothetical protein
VTSPNQVITQKGGVATCNCDSNDEQKADDDGFDGCAFRFFNYSPFNPQLPFLHRHNFWALVN